MKFLLFFKDKDWITILCLSLLLIILIWLKKNWKSMENNESNYPRLVVNHFFKLTLKLCHVIVEKLN